MPYCRNVSKSGCGVDAAPLSTTSYACNASMPTDPDSIKRAICVGTRLTKSCRPSIFDARTACDVVALKVAAENGLAPAIEGSTITGLL